MNEVATPRGKISALWFHIVVSVGILAVSAASATYIWQTWRAYDIERRADGICKYFVEEHLGADYAKAKEDVKTTEDLHKNVEAWIARRECINRIMGRENQQ
jgi:hypothetical protein